ncbi:MAG: ScyD/ScyE family protein [Caldilineaceae bacterium]|nr:ScyD/ScyE family protein [Caldilineaceae bacterium]
MHVFRRSLFSLILASALMISFLPGGRALWAQSSGEVIAEGFNGPMGILMDPNGDIWVIDSGLGGEDSVDVVNPETGEATAANMGNSARIVKVNAADGSQTDVATVPSVASESGASGGGRLTLIDGTLYATVGEWLSTPDIDPPAGLATLVEVNDDGSTTEVAQFWPYERDVNPYPPVMHAHPFGLTAGPDGSILVADAGGNALHSVDPTTGEITTKAVLEPLPGVFPRPEYDNQLLTDPVPTAVAVGADGATYISLLSGAPFIPGNAKVIKVNDDGSISDYATGLTMLIDLRTGPDGNLYAAQFSVFTETGPQPGSGAIIRIREGGDSEVVASGLDFVTSLDFDVNGDAYVTTNGVGAPGSGQVVKLTGLTGVTGTPIGEAMGGMQPPATGDANATIAPAEEGPAEAIPMEPTEEPMAEPSMEPTTLPVTGSSSSAMPGLLIVGAAMLLLAGVAVGARRKTAG